MLVTYKGVRGAKPPELLTNFEFLHCENMIFCTQIKFSLKCIGKISPVNKIFFLGGLNLFIFYLGGGLSPPSPYVATPLGGRCSDVRYQMREVGGVRVPAIQNAARICSIRSRVCDGDGSALRVRPALSARPTRTRYRHSRHVAGGDARQGRHAQNGGHVRCVGRAAL